MSLELSGESGYSGRHESCSFKGCNWITECTTQGVPNWSPGISQCPNPVFSFVIITRKQQCSLTRSWIVFFHFLCGVTVGSYFMFSSGNNCSFAVFPTSPFWHFSFLPCDSKEANVCTVGCSIPSLLVWRLWEVGREGGVCCLQQSEESFWFPSFFRGMVRQVEMREQLKTLG